MPRFAAALLMLAALGACKPPPPTFDPEAGQIARAFFDEVRSGGDLDADPHLAHELKNPTTEEQLSEFRTLIPAEPARSIELQKADVTDDSTGTTTKIAELYHYIGQTLLVQTALFKSPGGTDPVIVGFKVTPQPDASN